MTLLAKLEARRSQLKAQRRNAFTLLELLVVVAIIAIIAGAIISSYDGVDANAAASTSSHTAGSSDQIIRQYAYVNSTMPDFYETGLVSTSGDFILSLPNTSSATVNTVFDEFPLLANHVSALSSIGVKNVYYYSGTNTAAVLDALSNPNSVFDSASATTLATSSPVLRVKSANNSKFGAGTTDVLVALAIGSKNSLVTANSTVKLGVAPAAPGLLKNQYSRYFAVFNVGDATAPVSGAKAKFVTVIDANGKTVDDLIADSKN
ncbi:MAG: hypothetical protein RL095_3009 [Verrucomicrobiota bacterium]|jgi:prepilin-type N-terminal cleavage/methylation domain-containing protein